MCEQLGVIDIGSNSVRTMQAEYVDGLLRFSHKAVYTTRLGALLAQTGALPETAMAETLTVVRAFFAHMQARAIPVYAYATSAVRDASNREAFAARVREILGDRLEILTGEQEARDAFLAATGGDGGMLDIGGGSLQLVTSQCAQSFPMGCVRARSLCPVDRLSAISALLEPRLDALISMEGLAADRWTGVGGTVTTLAALALGLTTYERDLVQGAVLARDALIQTLARLDALGDDARADIPLLSKRHDVILHGGAILLYLMRRLAIDALHISDADGLEGYAMRLLHARRAI